LTNTLTPPNGASIVGADGIEGVAVADDVDEAAGKDCSERPRLETSDDEPTSLLVVLDVDDDVEDVDDDDTLDINAVSDVESVPNEAPKFVDDDDGSEDDDVVVAASVSGSIVVSSRPRRFFDDVVAAVLADLESLAVDDDGGLAASAALTHAVSPGISIQLLLYHQHAS
jgi:hypothetical protein